MAQTRKLAVFDPALPGLNQDLADQIEDLKNQIDNLVFGLEAVIPPTNTAFVDRNFISSSDNNVIFTNLEEALMWARGRVDGGAPHVLLKVYFDENQERISPNLGSHTWYVQAPQDENIQIISGLDTLYDDLITGEPIDFNEVIKPIDFNKTRVPIEL